MSSDFIRDMIRADVEAGKHGGKVVTRFPPEPNGYLHIGHAKAICLSFGVAQEFQGQCNLRMDDTNPTTEDMEYVQSIQNDVKWLGFDWGQNLFYASDYFERFYELGRLLIERGRAYVCDLSEEEFSKSYRGTITEAGKESPFRKRTAAENLDLFARMRAGEFPDGAKVLRAAIDMSSPNMKMRDPPLVRIKKAHHYRTDDKWCIYPLYDYAHCLEDSFEGVTHSLCTLEFESARELYDWVIQATEVPHVPRQTEFARLNLTYTVMSKRKLLLLVNEKRVNGWDDPRMPTIAGIRRRGYTPESMRDFCTKIGVAKNLSTVDLALLEACVRDDLDRKSPRVMAILRPLEVVVESYDEKEVEELAIPYWPEGTEPLPGVTSGSRNVPFSRTVFIEQDDFAETPPKGWHRMSLGREVRLRHAYVVKCVGVEKNEAGEIVRVRCTHDPKTRGGQAQPGQKVDGTIHWVASAGVVDIEARIYDRLFDVESPGLGDDWLSEMNPKSLVTLKAKGEPVLGAAKPGDRFQLERLGFFVVDADSKKGALVLNRTVALKDSWVKKEEPARSAKPKPAAAPQVHKVLELSDGAQALVTNHGLAPHEAQVVDAAPAIAKIFAEVIRTTPEIRERRGFDIGQYPVRRARFAEVRRPGPRGAHRAPERRHDIEESGERGIRRHAPIGERGRCHRLRKGHEANLRYGRDRRHRGRRARGERRRRRALQSGQRERRRRAGRPRHEEEQRPSKPEDGHRPAQTEALTRFPVPGSRQTRRDPSRPGTGNRAPVRYPRTT